MKSNVIAAVAGGLILGGAIFLPFGANAAHPGVVQVASSEQKVEAPSANLTLDGSSDESFDSVQAAGVDPMASTDQTSTPIAITTPTFSSDDDDDEDEDEDDDASYGEDSEDDESDD